jgi:hypothetical protein
MAVMVWVGQVITTAVMVPVTTRAVVAEIILAAAAPAHTE